MTFRERYMRHEAEFEEIFDLTDEWNFSDDSRTLREFLGLTVSEEDIWISESDEALELFMEQERKTKILFTDLDGTLLDDDKEITAGNRQAINEALALGHKIVISTGRPLASARIQAERLGLTKEGCYAISYNGGQIYDSFHKTTVYGKEYPSDLIAPVFQAAHEAGLHVQTYSDTHIVSERDTKALRRYADTSGVPVVVTDNAVNEVGGKAYKLLVIDYHDHQKLLDFQSQVLAKYAGRIDSFFSNDYFLEIVPTGVSKGFAVQWMCDFLQIPIENSVAAGDAQNDIPMLEAAHVGAVMCNAFPGIAEHGTYMTKADNNHDGVAEIIRRFILS